MDNPTVIAMVAAIIAAVANVLFLVGLAVFIRALNSPAELEGANGPDLEGEAWAAQDAEVRERAAFVDALREVVDMCGDDEVCERCEENVTRAWAKFEEGRGVRPNQRSRPTNAQQQ